MRRKKRQNTLVAFKVEPELAELLDQLPNKSAFIRKAVVAQLGVQCPLCRGKGFVPRGLYEHFARVIDTNRTHACDGCGSALQLPADPGDLSKEDRVRLEQFFLGGPLYCDSCYQAAPACGECEWHVDRDRIVDHRKKAHSENG
jgi:hypothetical protein